MPLIQSFPPVDGQTVQTEVLPTAGASQLNKIYQYVGTTTPQYVNGYFYKCIYNNPNYEWVNVLVQPEADPDPSVILTGTILANGWNNNAQTVTVNDFDSSTPGTIGLLNTVTGEQYVAAANAGLRVTAIANNSVTFSCEETPEIDIPFGILIPGTTVNGGGGTADYTYLDNKPQIANVTLQGNKSLADLGIASASDVETALGTKVDKVNGKGLSANDYTDEDKTIVSGVTSALADKVDKVAGKGLSTNDYSNEDKTIVDGISTALADKVDKVAGKGLSTNDYSDTEKGKVADNTSAISAIVNVTGAKNIMPYPYYETTKTENGVTFTDNGDGTLTISTEASGASADTYFILHAWEVTLNNGNYTLSGCPAGGSYYETYGLYIGGVSSSGTEQALGFDHGEGADFTINGSYNSPDYSKIRSIFMVRQGVVLTTPTTVKPMIRDARITDPTYVPYAMTNRELSEKMTSKPSFLYGLYSYDTHSYFVIIPYNAAQAGIITADMVDCIIISNIASYNTNISVENLGNVLSVKSDDLPASSQYLGYICAIHLS